ncbi:unnamed protein product, partial [Effrenium voratum]
RGSRIGSAHHKGVWHKLARSSSDFRRGGFVTHTTPKLDNPTARRITNTEYLKSLATDTFRESQDWFHHEHATARLPAEHSPRPSPRRGLFDSPSPSPRAMRRSMSERGVRLQELRQDKEKPVSLFDNGNEQFWASPRSPRGVSVRSPLKEKQASPPAGSAVRGRSETSLAQRARELSPRDTLQDAPAARSPRAAGDYTGRSPSRNWKVSEDWMSYSTAPEPNSPRMCGIRRLHSGKITRNSENWLRVNGEDSQPAAPMIYNSENFLGSKGKRTGLHKDLDVAKHLMRFEADRVAPPPPNNRRQHFQDNPQTAKHVEELRTLSPRRLRDAKRADALSPGRNTAAVDVQHRTSGEMAAAVQPDFTSPVAAAAEKYLVGCEIFDMASNGVRKGVKAKVRHHTNSDVVKEHIQPTCRHSCVMFCVASDRGNRRLGFLVKVIEESSLFYG